MLLPRAHHIQFGKLLLGEDLIGAFVFAWAVPLQEVHAVVSFN
jgi:hypothetical protein